MNNQYDIVTPKVINSLLHARFGGTFLSLKDLPNPSVFKDMDSAVARIVQAISLQQNIILIGDYDVDGVMSTSIIHKFFAQIDTPLKWVIPNRFQDGYGFSTSLLSRIGDADLIITVDNGISAVEAARECRALGIDLIITDHHNIPNTLPDAYAIINQKQDNCPFPYEEICGAQIAWYLCNAINMALGSRVSMKVYLEMVAIAIIADIMPLQHINRAMVQAGLKLLNLSETPFISVYKEQTNKQSLSAEDIAFGLAPLINSAGRIDDASLACDFITASNSYEARTYYDRLLTCNEQRKVLEEQVTVEASRQVNRENKVIVVASEGWHEGVVGIVAARLVQRFECPAIVLSQNGDICKGSGRSFNHCNLFDLVDTQRTLLNKFGGHSEAVGLSIDSDKLEVFREALESNISDHCSDEVYRDPDILGVLTFSYIDFTLLNTIAQYEPFGEGNPKPKFITSGVEILAVQSMGKDKNHLRFTLQESSRVLQAVQFKTFETYTIGDFITITYRINANHFRGNTTLQLLLEKVERD